MKRILPLLIVVSAGALPCFAQVEPRLAGDWHDTGTAFSLHVDANGRYTRHMNGQTDTGKFTAHDGNWQIHSDKGGVESGRFSMIGGNLKFSGGGMPSMLSRAQGSSAGHTSHTSHASHANHASHKSTVTHTVPNTVQMQSVPVQQVQQFQQIQQTAEQQQFQQQPVQQAQQQAPQMSVTQAIKNKLIQTINAIPTFSSQPQQLPAQYAPQASTPIPSVSSIPGASSIPGVSSIPNIPNIPNIPYVPNQIQQPLQQAVNQAKSQTYHSLYGQAQRSLPGYTPQQSGIPTQTSQFGPEHLMPTHSPQQDLQPSTQNPNSIPVTNTSPSHNQTINQYVQKAAQTADPSVNFDKWAAVQQLAPRNASGLQSVPRGGYIPVMKDNKARKFWGGR